MQRGVYFDAWFPRQHCYHPSLPPRRLTMIDDLEEYRATALVWAALGGGSISLPYLEGEAFGEIEPRMRAYGFVNDSEFVAACQARGITVFGIVFEVQGWEYPAELSEEEDRVLALNELRGAGKRAWLGLREFSQNRYPKIWPAFERYFPDGLRNSAGELVTDLLEEGCSRDIHGEPCHARWVECPDREHYCYTMDRNNPAWREYLKAIIRIQIDAGVGGVQLDEAELPITAMQYGGCFCRDCVEGFARHVAGLPPERLPEDLRDQPLDGFHYGSYLLERGYDFKENREGTPLFWEYLRFQRENIARYFGELADYARAYAAEQGRSVLVSGNFFNLFDHYYALEPKVDLVITEMRNTTYRQPAWYRYVAGFCGEKPVIVVENPYGGVIPELVARLAAGRGHDLFRLSLYEAAAMGASMSVPYGSWMGSEIEDSFWAPHDLCVEIQRYLAEHERLFSTRSAADVGVLYSIESNFEPVARRLQFADNRENTVRGEAPHFWIAAEALADAVQPFDVRFLPDGRLREDTTTLDDLRRYRALVVPGASRLSARQGALLREYLAQGGRLVVTGELDGDLSEADREAILGHELTTATDQPFTTALLDDPQIQLRSDADVAANLVEVEDGFALHLVRYGYDEAQDRVPPLAELALSVRLPAGPCEARAFAPDAPPAISISAGADGRHALELRGVPLFCTVLLTPEAE